MKIDNVGKIATRHLEVADDHFIRLIKGFRSRCGIQRLILGDQPTPCPKRQPFKGTNNPITTSQGCRKVDYNKYAVSTSAISKLKPICTAS